jgi:hypothetical protein
MGFVYLGHQGNPEFTGVEYDEKWASGLDPHAIGVAIKRGITSQVTTTAGTTLFNNR